MSDETPDLTELKDAVRAGLRKCRHEEAPIPIIRDADLFHITHMVATEVATAGFGPVRAVEAEVARLREERSSRTVAMDLIHEASEATARAESAEAALAGLVAKVGAAVAKIERQSRTCKFEHAADLRALLAPTPDREEACCRLVCAIPESENHRHMDARCWRHTHDREEARDE